MKTCWGRGAVPPRSSILDLGGGDKMEWYWWPEEAYSFTRNPNHGQYIWMADRSGRTQPESERGSRITSWPRQGLMMHCFQSQKFVGLVLGCFLVTEARAALSIITINLHYCVLCWWCFFFKLISQVFWELTKCLINNKK